MLEIYDENGHDILNMNDNLTRITSVARNITPNEAFRMLTPISEAERERMQKGEVVPFLLTNVLYDLTGDKQTVRKHIEDTLNIYDEMMSVRHDIIVTGVYNRV